MPLVIVPTPIGNLEDITLRALRELRAADVIACEDTRRTLRLLNHFDIKKELLSCHEHNERRRVDTICALLAEGKRVALVSDAGTPGLSDPGAAAAREAAARGFEVDVLPGANALLPALLLSGASMESFFFAGFLKGKSGEKRKKLEEISQLPDTLVFYVAPHRLTEELAFIASVLGDRRAALVREISKVHQETIRGTLLGICDTMPQEKIRGEFVCVVEGAEGKAMGESPWREEAASMAQSGERTKNIAAALAEKYGVQRNAVKRFIIENFNGEA